MTLACKLRYTCTVKLHYEHPVQTSVQTQTIRVYKTLSINSAYIRVDLRNEAIGARFLPVAVKTHWDKLHISQTSNIAHRCQDILKINFGQSTPSRIRIPVREKGLTNSHVTLTSNRAPLCLHFVNDLSKPSTCAKRTLFSKRPPLHAPKALWPLQLGSGPSLLHRQITNDYTYICTQTLRHIIILITYTSSINSSRQS